MTNTAELKSFLIKKAGTNELNADIDWLMADILNLSRNKVNAGVLVSPKNLKKILKGFAKLQKGMPLSLILHKANFYGRDYYVNKNVLCPRCETEELVELVLKNEKNATGLDLCTGSGAIAITLTKENPCLKMTASDISFKALKVAKFNAKKNDCNITFLHSNLFKKIRGKFDFVVCNPPYIKTKDIEKLDTQVKKYEPKLALDGGDDGLVFYRKIIKQLPNWLNDDGRVYFEIGFDEGEQVKNLLTKSFKDVKIIKDIEKNDRIVSAILK